MTSTLMGKISRGGQDHSLFRWEPNGWTQTILQGRDHCHFCVKYYGMILIPGYRVFPVRVLAWLGYFFPQLDTLLARFTLFLFRSSVVQDLGRKVRREKLAGMNKTLKILIFVVTLLRNKFC